MAQLGHISARGRAALLILVTGGTVLGAGVARSVAPATAATAASVTLSTTTPTVVTGHPANLKAIVNTGGAAPTGTVSFFLDGAAITPAATGTKTLSGGKNSVTAAFSMNTPGLHQFTAKYNGSAAFLPSAMSGQVAVNVVQAGTGQAAVSVVSSLGTTIPSATPLTLTAHVAGTPVPTGSVSFTDPGTSLPANRVLTAGAVSISVPSLPLGTNTIVANYSGDSVYAPASGTLTITVTAQPNDRFLQHLYTDMIGGQDPGGEAYWASQLAKGAARPAVAYAFTQTQAYDDAVVAQLYTNIMQRPAAADPSGAGFWAGQLRRGSTPERVAASMVASDERFISPSFGNNTVDTFIRATYQALLGRDWDAPGAAYWHDFVFTGGPRWQLTLDFVSGIEWAQVTVRNMYTKFHLGTPDPGALDYWAHQVLGGMRDDQLAAQLTGSQQYFDWTQAN
ncbi:MAG TPA: Ig-like domain repeat protein [Candidatus Dormibacteraeota bacterium]|jgi:hypothetical protein|nr:Ig-like domain repeat protein [Candidatus Dormibacteraeota bacterium]